MQKKKENNNQQSVLIKEIFENKYKYLSSEKIFEPTYYQCTLKEKFYQNGGEDEEGKYDKEDYSRLLEIPVKYIEEIINSQPVFFLWLHEKRDINKEMDFLVSISSRRMVNKMRNASPKDQAQGINALKNFSTYLKPEKHIDEYDEKLENINTLEAIEEELKEFGFTKEDDIITEFIGEDYDGNEEE